MTEFGVCETPDILRVIYFIKILINIIKNIVPICLILMVMFDCAKGVVNADKKVGDILGKNKNRLVSAALIFAIPTVINITLEIIDENTGYVDCWKNAESDKIEELQVKWDAMEKEDDYDYNNSYDDNSDDSNNSSESNSDVSNNTGANNSGSSNNNLNSGNNSNSSVSNIEKNCYFCAGSPEDGVFYTTNPTSNCRGGGWQEVDSSKCNFHINSINGIIYNLYNQSDSRWGTVNYPNIGKNISQIGCMISSTAVISSAYDDRITPKTVFDKARHQEPYVGIPTMTDNNFSCSKTTSISKSNVMTELKKGNVIVIQVKGKLGSSFTDSQHYMSLIDISEDGSKVYIGNSYGSGTGTYNSTGWFDINIVLNGASEVHTCTPSESILKKYNIVASNLGNNNNNNNNSSNSNSDSASNSNASNNNSNTNSGSFTTNSNITFSYQYVNNGSTMPYALYTPSSTNSSTGLIIWLHGNGEIGSGEGTLKGSGLLYAMNSWNLEGFNAYVLCPHLTDVWNETGGWCNETVKTYVYNLIDKIIKEKNINKSKIVIMGHSSGGKGALYMATAKPSYYSAIVVMSGYEPTNADITTLKNIPIRGYAENTGDTYYFMTGKFTDTFGSDSVTIYSGVIHGNVPKTALTEDKSPADGKSDLIVWALGQNKSTGNKLNNNKNEFN